MKTLREPKSMTPDRRRREIAVILAQGVLRYRRIAKLGLPTIEPKTSPQPQNCLELSGESRLHVADGSEG